MIHLEEKIRLLNTFISFLWEFVSFWRTITLSIDWGFPIEFRRKNGSQNPLQILFKISLGMLQNLIIK